MATTTKEVKVPDREELQIQPVVETKERARPKNIFVTSYPTLATSTLIYTGITDTSVIKMRVCNNSAVDDTISIKIGDYYDVYQATLDANDTIDIIDETNILTGTEITVLSVNGTTKFTINGHE